MKKSLFIALLSLLSLWWSAASGQATAKYFPTTPEEEQLDEECRKRLPEQEKYEVALIEHFSAAVEKTNAPNSDPDPFVEDCSTVAVSNSSDLEVRKILRLVDGPRAELCSDVLFFVDGESPVVCDYDPKLATGITDYKPTTAEQKDVEAACIENLKGPNGTRTALVLYESEPKKAFPGYMLIETLLPEDGNPYEQEECGSVFNPQEEANETRPVIIIFQSSTCHDVLYYEDGKNPVVCLYLIPDNTTTRHVAPKTPAIFVLVFTSLSVIASAALLVTHLIFPSLRTLPSKVIMNLSTAFLLGDIFYIVQTSLILDDPSQSSVIEPVAIVAYYFFYARFVWMALAGFEMCRTIHVGTQLRFNSAGKRLKIFLLYLIIGWSLPLIPTIIMAVVHFEELEEGKFGGRALFGLSGLVVVLVPVGIVMLFNFGTLLFLSYVLFKAHQWQIKVTDAIKSHKRKTNFMRIFIIILSMLGFTWILLFLIYVDGIQHTDPVLIITSILNTLQPIFVTVAFVGTKKIFRKYKNLCHGEREEDSVEATVIQNRFSKRRLISFLFTDKELADKVSKHPSKYRFGRSNRNDSKFSTTSVSMLTRDSSNSLVSQPPATNGVSTPPKDSLAPISEELEDLEEKGMEDSPNHVAADLKDSTV